MDGAPIVPPGPSFSQHGSGPQNVNHGNGCQFNSSASAFQANYSNVYCSVADDTRNTQCLRDLRQTDPRHDKKRIEEAKGGLLKDSYQWVLNNDSFHQWRDDPDTQLLWIKGDPGKGKTMLLCGIIDGLKSQHNICLSFFFCQATEGRLRNATSVLRGLIYLLVCQNEHLISYLREKYDHAGSLLFEDGNAWVALCEILTSMLQDPNLNTPVLIVDALDECEGNRDWLLDFISRPSRAKWIVSSRNWPAVEERLNKAEQKIRLHLELNEDSVSHAVNIYIRHQVNQLAKDKGYTAKIKDNVQHHLENNAQGTFLWVGLVCQELRKVLKLQTLDKLKTFPPGLNSLYTRMMDQIRGLEYRDLCKELLATVSVVYRTVTLDELRYLAKSFDDLDQGDLEDAIRSCGSFITLRDGTVAFVHQSAKDYLLDKASGEVLPSGIAHQHYEVFTRSLNLLFVTLRRDIYDLRAPGYTIEKAQKPDPNPLAAVRYACVFWISHFTQSKEYGPRLPSEARILAFFREKFLHWAESLSLLRCTHEGIKAIDKLKACVYRDTSLELYDMVKDARRFLLSHRTAIEAAPLQVYASALIFSPTNSLIRRHFCQEEPSWVEQKPEVEAGWNACLQILEGHNPVIHAIAFSPDGRRLASSAGDYNDAHIKIWDTSSGECTKTLRGGGNGAFSIAFSPDGQRLASGAYRAVNIWDLDSGECTQAFKGHNARVRSVAFSSDGQRVTSGSDDASIKIWDVTPAGNAEMLEGHGSEVQTIEFLGDGRRLASSSRDPNAAIKIWGAGSGHCEQTYKGHSSYLHLAMLSPGSKQHINRLADDTIQIWDLDSGESSIFNGRIAAGSRVVFSPDGRRLASVFSTHIELWGITSGKCSRILWGHKDWIHTMIFSPDSQRLASASSDATIRIWDIISGKCAYVCRKLGWYPYKIVFSPNGQRLASSSLSGKEIRIWDTTSGHCTQILQGHVGAMSTTAFSVDGQRLASSSVDGAIIIWGTTSGEHLLTISVGREIRSMVFDAKNHSRLSTEIGTFIIDLPSSQVIYSAASALSADSSRSGYGISPDGMWIMKGSAKMLWIPPEYRPCASAVSGSTIAVGCENGRVWIIRFHE